MKIIGKGLEAHNKKYPNGELDNPAPDISLVLKDKKGKIAGGVITSMLTGVMHLEVLWVDKKYRRQGYGKDLVLEAERIGKKKGYSASQTWTFSFQAPEFYQSIGYKVLGIYDGYTNGITEYILLKKFSVSDQIPDENNWQNEEGFTIVPDASAGSISILHAGLHEHVKESIGDLRKRNPEIKIQLAIKNEEGQIIGGLFAFTTLKTMHTTLLWIHEKYRRKGYGKELLMTAERIAKENGCISGLANVLSFQAPEFFQKLGYEIFGVSDGYPDSIKEYFFKKSLQTLCS